jgi:hypothetical protein
MVRIVLGIKVSGGRCLPPLICAIFPTAPREYPAHVESKEIAKATARCKRGEEVDKEALEAVREVGDSL